MNTPMVRSESEPSPYVTLRGGARRWLFTETAPKAPEQAFREWLNRHAVPVRRRGRVYLVEIAVVEAAMERF